MLNSKTDYFFVIIFFIVVASFLGMSIVNIIDKKYPPGYKPPGLGPGKLLRKDPSILTLLMGAMNIFSNSRPKSKYDNRHLPDCLVAYKEKLDQKNNEIEVYCELDEVHKLLNRFKLRYFESIFSLKT